MHRTEQFLAEEYTTVPTQVTNVGSVLVDTGMLWMINAYVAHPNGYALTVDGRGGVGLLDATDTPEILVIDPVAFEDAKRRYQAFLRSRGYPAQRRRVQKIGVARQTLPDYRQQPDYRKPRAKVNKRVARKTA